MGASQSNQELNVSNEKYLLSLKNAPELRISSETWTRESHGLYDFEGNEVTQNKFCIKGSHNFNRADSDIYLTAISANKNFEENEEGSDQQQKEQVIARCLYQSNSYWLYHKNLIDENLDSILERKPEEKIWQVVKQNHQTDLDFPSYKLRRRDLIKVGRVRFKIRDIMSPIYKDKNLIEDQCIQNFKQIYPSFEISSINDVSEIQNDQQPNQNQQIVSLEDTESEVEEDQAPNNQIQHQQTSITVNNAPALLQSPSPIEKKQKKTDHEKQLKQASEQTICRICLTEEEDPENPLISPCHCAGSMRFIHHQCLKQWFHQRRVMKVTAVVTTYFWKNLECELCKQSYPYETKSLDGREMLNIIDYDLPKLTHYIVLESISSNTSKVIHVLNMQSTSKVYIGRGHDAHVRVTDISVSRLHAMLFKAPNNFYYLVDNASKFGTLALVRTPIQLLPKMKTQFQISRSLLNIEVKEPQRNIFRSCMCLGGDNNLKKNQNDLLSLITIDGVDYFPQEFASKAFLKLMMTRKKNQTKLILSKSKHQKNKSSGIQNNNIVPTTQQNDSAFEAIEHVDNYVVNLQQEPLSPVHSSPEIIQQDDADSQQSELQQNDSEENEDSQAGEEEESEEVEASHQSRLEQLELQQLDEAIQQSIQLQQQLQLSREQFSIISIPLQQDQTREENKQEVSLQLQQQINSPSNAYDASAFDEEAKNEYNDFSGQLEHKSHNVPQQEELISNISTSRMSQLVQNPRELRSSQLLQLQVNQSSLKKSLVEEVKQNKNGEEAERNDAEVTIMHDLPTQVYQKAKAVSLHLGNNQLQPKSQRFAQGFREQDMVNYDKVKSHRNTTQNDITGQIIVEQHYEGEGQDNNPHNDQQQIQTIDLPQIPNSVTDVYQPK